MACTARSSKTRGYNQYAIIDAGLSDGVVLAQVKAVSIYGPQPSYVDITWDKEILKKKNPFPFLKNNAHIYPYNEAAEKKLRGLAASPAPAHRDGGSRALSMFKDGPQLSGVYIIR